VTKALTVTINRLPAFTASSATFSRSGPNSFLVSTTGFPTAVLTQTRTLPAGVTFADNGDGTGTLSGTPTDPTISRYSLTFRAQNAAGYKTQAFTLNEINGGGTAASPAQRAG
jgi:hypothetical protein